MSARTMSMLIKPVDMLRDVNNLASLNKEQPHPFMDTRHTSSQHVPLWVKIIVPWLVVVLTTFPAWWPWLCKKVKSACFNMRSALSITNLQSTLLQRRPELIGASLVGLVAFLGLLLQPGGYLMNDKTLPLPYTKATFDAVEMRRLWPTLLHPDSLLVLQQLLRAVGFGLLLLRGCAGSLGGGFSPAFLQMALCSALRLELWGSIQDYEPEGPLGGKFGVCCVALTLLVQLLATYKAIRAACEDTSLTRRRLQWFQLVVQLFITYVAATTNHFTVGGTTAADVTFMAIDAGDVMAAPLFSMVACASVTQNVVGICPALIFMCAAQFLGFSWLLDFLDLDFVYLRTFEKGSNEEFIRGLSAAKRHILKSKYGDPIVLLCSSHFVQLGLTILTCIMAIGLQRGYFREMFDTIRPKGASKEVIQKLESVPYTEGMFGDESGECCAICLAEFEVGEKLRRLPCQHQQFHAECVDHWLTKAGRCPLCVADIHHHQCDHAKTD